MQIVLFEVKKMTFILNKELKNISIDYFKTNKIINSFLLTGDKLLPQLYSEKPGFTYSTCGSFTKHCEWI